MPPSGPLQENVREYIRRLGLLRPGDRVGVAVSGGADSVALLRLLLELRGELGVVLQVLHFHHGIRGAEADADQQFVADLAAAHGLELQVQAGDSPAHAAAHNLSLETAARELRYAWFAELLGRGTVNRLATAHTLDDQAETVLMRTLRGAGTRGMAGIYPQLQIGIIRPLLRTRRQELQDYLRSCDQPWREDQSNLDLRHLRNRIRHQLLPLLERDFNPAVKEVLATQAEIARAEEDFWRAEVSRFFAHGGTSAATRSAGNLDLDPCLLMATPRALQRRLVRAATEALGLQLEFRDVEQIRHLAHGRDGDRRALSHGWMAVRGQQELCIVRQAPATSLPGDYEYRLPVPGEIAVAELGSVFRASLVPPTAGAGEYNALLPNTSLTELVVRNWRAGDRFRPAHTRSPKKVKTLLHERRVAQAERRLWPVVLSGTTSVWMRGFPAQPLAATGPAARLRIEEVSGA